MALASLTDGIARGAERAAARAGAAFEPVVRLGVTGLSRAGKTVFISGLVANLLDRGRMGQLAAVAGGRVEAVYLQPQPDMTLPRFDYEGHLAALTGEVPHWPESTRAVSELRLSFRLRPAGFLGGVAAGLTGPRVVHLDIVDYPGEWLLDLSLMERSYGDWAEAVLDRLAKRAEAAGFLAVARAEDGALGHDEGRAQALAACYTRYMVEAQKLGRSDLTPGRFLLPGDLAGSPVLTFAPLPRPASVARGSLWREMERRYDAYREQVVRPFFRDHFARIDRQVVLADVLGAIHKGPQAVEELRRSMAEVLGAFRHGQNGWLTRLLGGRRVERLLFAATKADHLHHSQHAALSEIVGAMLREAKDRAEFAGAKTAAMSVAGFRATVEDEALREGVSVGVVRGRVADGRTVAMYAGRLPEDPARLLVPARAGAERWLDAEFGLMAFQPVRMALKPGDGVPHIRLDRAAEFLFGDRL